jgi:hypothetical protein
MRALTILGLLQAAAHRAGVDAWRHAVEVAALRGRPAPNTRRSD